MRFSGLHVRSHARSYAISHVRSHTRFHARSYDYKSYDHGVTKTQNGYSIKPLKCTY